MGPVLGFEIIDTRRSDMIFLLKLTLVLITKVIFCEYVSWVTILGHNNCVTLAPLLRFLVFHMGIRLERAFIVFGSVMPSSINFAMG